jgi:hypothetical protein
MYSASMALNKEAALEKRREISGGENMAAGSSKSRQRCGVRGEI